MVYAFFNEDGSIDKKAMRLQVDTLVDWGAHGIGTLGLASEVHKLSAIERRELLEIVAEALNGRLPLAVTVSDRTSADQISFGNAAKEVGAAWLILQPAAVRDVGEKEHIRFFGKVADGIDLPIGLQIAPAYLGQGFAPENLIPLQKQHANVQLMKLETTALGAADFITRTEGVFDVFNGQAGVGMIDCIEAGCKGFIPGAETGDISSLVYSLYNSDDEAARHQAVDLYKDVLPLWHMIMESIDTFLIYGKPLLSKRIGLDQSRIREPHGQTSAFGNARLAALSSFLDKRA